MVAPSKNMSTGTLDYDLNEKKVSEDAIKLRILR